MARERLEAERDASRLRWSEVVRVSAECLGSCALGLAGIGFAWHTTDHDWGMICWWAGLVVGYSGISTSLVAAYLRAEKRGGW